ncbi:MAG TPA: alpha-L-glutamate ligase [Alphaproteobacteria bacterium]|nr:alpha-L-glutamate ligase [Alphaproteobacteria bacterium]
MSRVYVLHENDAWVEPLRAAFKAQGTPFSEWFLDEGTVDLSAAPPEGVFYNRMSASSYTRDHRYGPEYTAIVLAWLERHGRRVVNDTRALRLEVSKAAQYAALESAGIRTPCSIAAVGRKAIIEAAERFDGPVILKPNRGGKGHGVQLFANAGALKAHVASDAYEPPVDGVSLLQEYIKAPEPFITRAEFIGGRFFYAVRVDTRQGFELCPADQCAAGDAFCPIGETQAPRFQIIDGIDSALRRRYEAFLAANGIGIAGVEFIVDAAGTVYTYDINTNTNYNPDAEARDGRSGMRAIARYLEDELVRLYHAPELSALAIAAV